MQLELQRRKIELREGEIIGQATLLGSCGVKAGTWVSDSEPCGASLAPSASSLYQAGLTPVEEKCLPVWVDHDWNVRELMSCLYSSTLRVDDLSRDGFVVVSAPVFGGIQVEPG